MSIEFKILKKSKRSWARLGILETSHGVVETPSLVPVATQAAVKTLTSEEVLETKSQILIANTFHLHLKPGEKIVKAAGGLHKFMNWSKPLMTDSGGFQVFSLGFGRDLQVGKITKYFPGQNQSEATVITPKSAPKFLKITPDGVRFRSFFDGKELFLGPKESIKIQEALGADIIFAFDECTPPLSNIEYVEGAVGRTHRWAKICLETKKGRQALFGIVQGSRYKSLREESAKYINSLEFDGFGIGGDLGSTRKDMNNILKWTLSCLDESKPRHLLGVGRLEDLKNNIRNGIDLFDCTVPTQYGRHGVAFTASGKLNLRQTKFLKDKKPLDNRCQCRVCQTYKRNYIAHLIRAGEIAGLRMLSFHNLYYFNTLVENLRNDIKNGKL
jgi:queuine tRNA-ribosyltransferase/7-cyano-7-deazaguanine tRNA-ribosyltransferase